MISATVAISYYLYVWALSYVPGSWYSKPQVFTRVTVIAPTFEYNEKAGFLSVCACVKNMGTEPIDTSALTAELKESDLTTFSYAKAEQNVVIPPKNIATVCFSFGNPPPGEYTILIHTPEGSSASAPLKITPYCTSDANCPDVVEIDGDRLISKDMFCDAGACEVNATKTYICYEFNAVSCESIALHDNNYYCEVHGSGTVWTNGLIEFLDDLNDNDCDGTVERECNSCASCTYELNIVARSLISTGENVMIFLAQDLAPSASELIPLTASDGYWNSSSSTCVLAENMGSIASPTVVFDLNGHEINVPGYTGVQLYGAYNIVVQNGHIIGSSPLSFDIGADYGFARNLSLSGSSDYVLIDGGYATKLSDLNIYCSSVTTGAVSVKSLQAYATYNHVYIDPSCYLSIDASYLNNSTLQDINDFSAYGYAFTPKYNTIQDVRCKNGKYVFPIYNVSQTVIGESNACGYILNPPGTGDMNLYLNGQTLVGYGIGTDSGTLRIYGPGTITGSVYGLYVDNESDGVIIDLSQGDVNICGNLRADIYDVSVEGNVTCVNCGNGYYLRYNTATGTIDCNANCVLPC